MIFHRNHAIAKWVGTGLLILLLISAVHADTVIMIEPGSLNITSHPTNVTRTVILTATGDLTNLEFIPLDIAADKGDGVIPAEFITAFPENTSMVNGSIQKVPINFNMHKVESGIYKGELWFSSTEAGVVKVPITVTLRDYGLWPGIVLFFAVGVSFGLFKYSESGKKKDEVKRDLITLKENIEKDNDLKDPNYYYARDFQQQKNPFYTQITANINTAESSLEMGDVTLAESNLKKAKDYWNFWNNNRDRLPQLFDGIGAKIEELDQLEDRIKEKLKDLNPEITGQPVPAISARRSDLQEKFMNICVDQDTKKLQTSIETSQIWYNRIKDIYNKMQTIESVCVVDQNCPACKDWKKDWIKLASLDTKENIDAFLNVIGPKEVEVNNCKKSYIGDRLTEISEREGKVQFLPDSKPLEILKLTPLQRSILRLLLYNWGIFIVMVIVLALFGFQQLYLNNPTFGSAEDWITLVLWGLLVGSTADAVATKAKGTIFT